jgi:hypothetical protein
MTKENKDSNKSYNEYKKSHPEQLDLFSFSNVFEDKKEKYSGTVELYDLVPKYFYDDVEKSRKDGKYLDILSRNFIYRKQNMQLNMTPARLLQKNGSTKDFFPSQREEIIEDVLRKLATDSNRNEFLDDRLSVRFTLYELWKELKTVKHTFSYDEIRESLEILSKTNIEIVTKDNKITFSSNMFETFGRVNENEESETNNELEDYNRKITYFVRFNSLVSESIKNKTWRIINYDQCMAYRKVISRWLHKRISHMFLCNKIELPYNILLSTIIRDSGMTEYKQLRDSVIQVQKCLDEMISVGSIFKYEVEKIFSQEKTNKIEDVKFLIYISKSFYEDMRLGNLALFDSDKIKQIQEDTKAKYKENNNQSIINSFKDSDSNINTETDSNFRSVFKKEIIEDINSLFSKNNILLSNQEIEKALDKVLQSFMLTIETKDIILNNVKACIDYIKNQISSNKKHNDIAILTKSIKENWKPNETDCENTNNNLTAEDQTEKAKNLINIQTNKEFKQILQKLLENFDENTFNSWLAKLSFKELEKNILTLSVETIFIKEYIEKHFLNGSKKKVDGKWVYYKKGIKQVVQDLYPNIENLIIISSNNN